MRERSGDRHNAIAAEIMGKAWVNGGLDWYAPRDRTIGFRRLFQHCLEGVIVHTEDRRIVAANPIACQILGYSEEELIRGGTELIADYRDPELLAAVEERRRSGSHRSLRRLRRSDGQVITAEAGLVSYQDEEGNAYIFAFFTEVPSPDARESAHSRESSQFGYLWRQLQAMREEEHKRLAVELQDGIAQFLTAMKLDLAWIRTRLPPEQDALREKLDSCTGMVNSMFESVHRLAGALRPRALDDVGLVGACEWLLKEYSRANSTPYRFFSSHDEFELDEDYATTVYRIVQEAVSNVHYHAAASSVSLSLVHDEERSRLVISVADDGRGFDVAAVTCKPSFGLADIRERARMYGGTMHVKSAPGKGTRVRVELPLGGAAAPGRAPTT